MKRHDIVGIGSMVVDVLHRVPRLIGAEKVAVESVSEVVGGVTLNHLAWARLLGLRAALFGRQGDDARGRFIREEAERLGLTTHLVRDGSASSVSLIFIDSLGARSIYMAPGATAETRPEHVAQFLSTINASASVSTEVSQLPLATVAAILRAARSAGAMTFLDVDVPPSVAVGTLGTASELEEVISLADVLKPTAESARELIGDGSPGALAERLRRGRRLVAITDGAAGCVLSERTTIEVPALPATVLDTTGAGDAFFGGLIAGVHQGLDLAGIGALANACGAACVEILGAVPDSTARERVRSRWGGVVPEPDSVAPGRREVEQFLLVARRETGRIGVGAVEAAAALIGQARGAGGRVHVTGVGKCEHLAALGAALLSSVGTPATLLHATECIHGSLGQVVAGDVVVALSNSGETSELLLTLPPLRERGTSLIAITGGLTSSLARAADVVLDSRVTEEGGPLGLVPRASLLTQTLVLGALAVALEVQVGLSRSDYARLHPAGSIGARARS